MTESEKKILKELIKSGQSEKEIVSNLGFKPCIDDILEIMRNDSKESHEINIKITSNRELSSLSRAHSYVIANKMNQALLKNDLKTYHSLFKVLKDLSEFSRSLL